MPDMEEFNPINLGPDPTADQFARARAYGMAEKTGRLAEIPGDWNPDGTLKSEETPDQEVTAPAWAGQGDVFRLQLDEENDWHPGKE